MVSIILCSFQKCLDDGEMLTLWLLLPMACGAPDLADQAQKYFLSCISNYLQNMLVILHLINRITCKILHNKSLTKAHFHSSFPQVQEIIYQNGETALLPCDISNNNPGDRVTLLLWYKEDLSALSKGMGSPIYRIDARTNKDIKIGQSSVPILDWVNEELLGKNRVSFDTQLSPASLKIRNVSESDAGLYRCRVDFTTSQTRTERLNLRVIIRPSRPRIFDDSGTVRDIFAGPYQEGSEVYKQ